MRVPEKLRHLREVKITAVFVGGKTVFLLYQFIQITDITRLSSTVFLIKGESGNTTEKLISKITAFFSFPSTLAYNWWAHKLV